MLASAQLARPPHQEPANIWGKQHPECRRDRQPLLSGTGTACRPPVKYPQPLSPVLVLLSFPEPQRANQDIQEKERSQRTSGLATSTPKMTDWEPLGAG